MFKVSFTLPTVQHNGTSNLPIINSIKTTIAQRYGGYSSSTVDGGWFDNETGHLYEEPSILVWTFAESQEQVDELLACAPQWACDLQQIELLVTVEQAVDVHFIAGTRAQAVA